MILILGILFNSTVYGQVPVAAEGMLSTDSLSLKYIIQRVVTTYPTVKVAEEAINNADARIGLARTGYNPELDLDSCILKFWTCNKTFDSGYGDLSALS